MNRRVVYILVLVALGLILTATAKYLPMPVFLSAYLIIMLALITRAFISIRKRAITTGQWSRLQQASIILMYSSVFGFIIAVVFTIFHLGYIRRPLFNFSMGLYISGAMVGIIAVIKSGYFLPNLDKRQNISFGTIIYLDTICAVTGLILKYNHFPGGELIVKASLSFLFIFLAFLIIYTQYMKKKKLQ